MPESEEVQREWRRDLWRGIILESFASPFFWNGADAMMDQKWARMFVAYLVGLIFALPGLFILGGLLPSTKTHLGHWFSLRVARIADDSRWWILIWIILLVYLGGPFFVKRLVLDNSSTSSNPITASVEVHAPTTMPTPIREIVYVTPAPTPVPSSPPPLHILSIQQTLALVTAFESANQQIQGANKDIFENWKHNLPPPDPTPHPFPYHLPMYVPPNTYPCTIVVDAAPSNGEFMNQVVVIAEHVGCLSSPAIKPSPLPISTDVDATPQPTSTPAHVITVTTGSIGWVNPVISTAIDSAADSIRSTFATPPFRIHAQRIPGPEAKRSYPVSTIYIDLGDCAPWSRN